VYEFVCVPHSLAAPWFTIFRNAFSFLFFFWFFPPSGPFVFCFCCFVVHLIHAIKDLAGWQGAHALSIPGEMWTLFWHIFLVYVSLDPRGVALYVGYIFVFFISTCLAVPHGVCLIIALAFGNAFATANDWRVFAWLAS